MSIITSPLLLGADKAAGYTISRSLRFNSSDSAYLSRTPASAGNRKTWTWAGWVKRSAISFSAEQHLWGVTGVTDATYGEMFFSTGDTLRFAVGYTTTYGITTTRVFRDASAWYHIVLAFDATQSTATNKIKLYINGVEETVFSSDTRSSLANQDWGYNNNVAHYIGRNPNGDIRHFNGYLADIHFIDGQALTPSSFTEVSATTGQLVPKAYTGSFGTNGFWLKFSDNSTAAALGTDSSGNNNTWTVNNLSNVSGGPTSVAAASGGLPVYNTTDTYGATKGSGTRTDSNSSSIVLAIPMDGANNGTTFTDESATIKGSGSAKTISRFGDTKTSTAQSKYYGSSGFFDGTGDYLRIAAGADFSYGLGDFTFECWVYTTTSGVDQIIFGQTSSGNNFVNIALTTANLLSVQINSSGAGNNVTSSGAVSANRWNHIAVTRSSATVRLFINGVLDGSGTRNVDLSLASIEPSIGTYSHASTLNFTGYISDFRIYKGVAKYTSNFNPPSSTQNPTIAAGNDSLVDTPTSYGTDTSVGGEVRGNYATLNPLDNGGLTLANGNLDASRTTASWVTCRSTIGISSGKWYFEATGGGTGGSLDLSIGVCKANATLSSYVGSDANGWAYVGNTGLKYTNGSSASYGAAYNTNGDIVGVAFDADNGTLTFYKNGVSQGQAYSGLTSGPYFFAISIYGSTSFVANFGQRPFAYTAPSGFKALCDTNLPAPVVAKPSEVMDVKLYTGNGSTQNITGLGFSPDFIWIKARSQPYSNTVFDVIRGATNYLYTDTTGAEGTGAQFLTAFNSDGFSLGTNAAVNQSSTTYAAWTWDAGSSTVTNTQGSITSQVRANASAGFSIVTYTGPGPSNNTVGHGLGVAPELIITKNRDRSIYWIVYTKATGKDAFLRLNTTDVSTASSNIWGTAAPTSTVFGGVGTDMSNGYTAGEKIVSYCFAPVAGYSSFGSYTGNGSADGPFVYTGHRVRWLLVKNATNGGSWVLHDTARSTYNVSGQELLPDSSGAEYTFTRFDFLSNGFKGRSTNNASNTNGDTYIYAAFAENPFQYARAK